MRKYRDRGIDLADTALLPAAEREGIGDISAVSRKDFAVYRLHGPLAPTILP